MCININDGDDHTFRTKKKAHSNLFKMRKPLLDYNLASFFKTL